MAQCTGRALNPATDILYIVQMRILSLEEKTWRIRLVNTINYDESNLPSIYSTTRHLPSETMNLWLNDIFIQRRPIDNLFVQPDHVIKRLIDVLDILTNGMVNNE